jgi:hypothetical protein
VRGGGDWYVIDILIVEAVDPHGRLLLASRKLEDSCSRPALSIG